MQTTDQIFGLGFVNEKADVSLRRALGRSSACRHRKARKTWLAIPGWRRTFLADEADEGFCGFSQRTSARPFSSSGDGGQRVGRVHEERQAAARGREQVEAVLVALEDFKNLAQKFGRVRQRTAWTSTTVTRFLSCGDGFHHALVAGMSHDLGSLAFGMARVQHRGPRYVLPRMAGAMEAGCRTLAPK